MSLAVLNHTTLCDRRTAYVVQDGVIIDDEYVHRFDKNLVGPFEMVIATPDGLYLDGKRVLEFDVPEGQGAIAYATEPIVINNDNRTFGHSRPERSSEDSSRTRGEGRRPQVVFHGSNGGVGLALGNVTVIHHNH